MLKNRPIIVAPPYYWGHDFHTFKSTLPEDVSTQVLVSWVVSDCEEDLLIFTLYFPILKMDLP